MKEPKAVFNPYPLLIIIIIPLIFSVVAVIMGEYIGASCLFIIYSASFIWFIFARKKFFSKMLIDDNGIKVYYRKKIIKQINWKDIKDAQAFAPARYSAGGIMFTDTKFYTGKEKWKNSEFISIGLTLHYRRIYIIIKTKFQLTLKIRIICHINGSYKNTTRIRGKDERIKSLQQ